MTSKAAGFALALGLSLGATRQAAACHDGFEIVSELFFVIPSVLVDTSLAAHDLIVSSSSHTFGIAEISLTAPQLVGGLWVLNAASKTCEETGGPISEQTDVDGHAKWVMAFAIPLLAHGIYVVARPRSASRSQNNVTMIPGLVGDRADGVGLALVGRF